MTIVEDVRNTTARFPDVVLTVGSFDGVHLGHQCILEAVRKKAEAINGSPAVLTMRPHPREFFFPDHAPNLLTSDKKKAELLEHYGMDVLYVLEFNRESANLEPEDFVREIIVGQCGAKAVVVGHDCRFGKGAKGDFELLKSMAPECGFTAGQVAPLVVDSERVSSTLIRERLLQGDLAAAQSLLGRRYSVCGEVTRGRGLGEQLGFPTANIKPHHNAVPAQGVYIAEVCCDGRRLPAAVNIGIAPTIRHEDLTIEAHVLDFDEDLLGHEIEIVFHQRIRPEKKFDSVEALKDQIADDVRATREYFGLAPS